MHKLSFYEVLLCGNNSFERYNVLKNGIRVSFKVNNALREREDDFRPSRFKEVYSVEQTTTHSIAEDLEKELSNASVTFRRDARHLRSTLVQICLLFTLTHQCHDILLHIGSSATLIKGTLSL
ncbi:hypothetical protein CEXT_175671 [Caerostris extrusa]|uniref:Uncharacterized protein n=1 Tax=Caerostris extrusa TaxID=172846 RepID=A0AAV4MCQ8_CAEEX|nr:hypothetical protein CEXT_175671 [Caerostris extrusa]